MNKPEESFYPQAWRMVAHKDWQRMMVLFAAEDTEGAAFFLQQSPEKYLKAYLLGHAWKLRKIHELDILLDEAVKFDTRLEAYRDVCEQAAGYYFTERYPALVPAGLEPSELKYIQEQAKQLVAILFPGELL